MEGMGTASNASRHGKLNDGALGEVVDRVGGQELIGSILATEKLQENRESRRFIGSTVYSERSSETELKVDADIGVTNSGSPRLRQANGQQVGDKS